MPPAIDRLLTTQYRSFYSQEWLRQPTRRQRWRLQTWKILSSLLARSVALYKMVFSIAVSAKAKS
jgi:hypothetical protein